MSALRNFLRVLQRPQCAFCLVACEETIRGGDGRFYCSALCASDVGKGETLEQRLRKAA